MGGQEHQVRRGLSAAGKRALVQEMITGERISRVRRDVLVRAEVGLALSQSITSAHEGRIEGGNAGGGPVYTRRCRPAGQN